MENEKNIEVRIEALALYGFSPHDAAGIAAAVERELQRLLSERGLPAGLARETPIESLKGLHYEGRPSSGAAATGNRIAGSLYRGFAGGGRKGRKP